VRLDTAALTYFRSFLYLDEWPNEAAISNRTTIEIDRLYDNDVLTKLNTDNSRIPDLGPRAGGLLQGPRLAGALTQRCLLSLPDESKALT
jgi:hypothetical protein